MRQTSLFSVTFFGPILLGLTLVGCPSGEPSASAPPGSASVNSGAQSPQLGTLVPAADAPAAGAPAAGAPATGAPAAGAPEPAAVANGQPVGPGAGPGGEAPGARPTAPGAMLRMMGKLILPASAPAGEIQLDVNPVVPGNSRGPLTSSRMKSAGDFTLNVPPNAGSVNIMIYLGVTGTDPGSVPPENVYSWGPLEVTDRNIEGINIDLSQGASGAAPR